MVKTVLETTSGLIEKMGGFMELLESNGQDKVEDTRKVAQADFIQQEAHLAHLRAQAISGAASDIPQIQADALDMHTDVKFYKAHKVQGKQTTCFIGVLAIVPFKY